MEGKTFPSTRRISSSRRDTLYISSITCTCTYTNVHLVYTYIYKYTWRSFVSPWSLARALRVGREVKRSSLLLLLLSTFLLLPPLSLRSREGIVCTLYPLLSFRSPFSLPEATLLSRFSLGSPCLARPIHAPRDLATPPTEPQIAFIPWID